MKIFKRGATVIPGATFIPESRVRPWPCRPSLIEKNWWLRLILLHVSRNMERNLGKSLSSD